MPTYNVYPARPLVANDTGTILVFTVQDRDGELIEDIVSAVLRYTIAGGAPVEKDMDVDGSVVSYQFGSSGSGPVVYELTPGTLRAEVTITDSFGKELTGESVLTVEVRDRL